MPRDQNGWSVHVKGETMQKILKNKLFISTACLVLAAVLSFVLLPKMYEDRTATANVLVLNQTVDEGTKITENLLSTAEVGAFGLSGAVHSQQSRRRGQAPQRSPDLRAAFCKPTGAGCGGHHGR